MLPGGWAGEAVSINSSNDAVGNCFTNHNFNNLYALFFSGGTVSDLGGLPSTFVFHYSQATGIADDGTIAGVTTMNNAGLIHGWVIYQGVMNDLTNITDQAGISFYPVAVSQDGKILAYQTVSPNQYAV